MIDALDQVLGRETALSLLGFSVGGLMATAIAARLGPRVQRLALCAVGGYWTDEIVTLDLKGPRRGMSETELRAIHRHNLGTLMFADPSRIDEYAVTLQGENVARNRFDTRLLGLKHHISLFLPKVTCPVMMIFGGRDNDTMLGKGGNDLMFGGSGDDTLTGGDGDDQSSTSNPETALL